MTGIIAVYTLLSIVTVTIVSGCTNLGDATVVPDAYLRSCLIGTDGSFEAWSNCHAKYEALKKEMESFSE